MSCWRLSRLLRCIGSWCIAMVSLGFQRLMQTFCLRAPLAARVRLCGSMGVCSMDAAFEMHLHDTSHHKELLQAYYSQTGMPWAVPTLEMCVPLESAKKLHKCARHRYVVPQLYSKLNHYYLWLFSREHVLTNTENWLLQSDKLT